MDCLYDKRFRYCFARASDVCFTSVTLPKSTFMFLESSYRSLKRTLVCRTRTARIRPTPPCTTASSGPLRHPTWRPPGILYLPNTVPCNQSRLVPVFGIRDILVRIRIRTGTSGQGCGSGLDPDPDWIRIQSGQWIRIRIRNPDPDPGGQKWPTKVEIFLKSSCIEVLDGLFWELKASSVTWTFFMEA